MKSALSPEQWERELADNVAFWLGRDRHALAALALDGQDFGFTWDDVEQIHAARKIVSAEHPVVYTALGFIGARIQGLLPPRKK